MLQPAEQLDGDVLTDGRVDSGSAATTCVGLPRVSVSVLDPAIELAQMAGSDLLKHR